MKGSKLKYWKVILAVFLSFIMVACTLGYKNDGDEVTWNTWNEGSGYNSYQMDADPETFKELNDDYACDNTHAFFKGDVIEGADGPSFRVIKHPYAADNTHIYLSGRLIDKAEPTTFKVHSDYFAEDANDFYWNGSALNVRDKATFQLLGNARMWGTAWAKDRYNAYYLPGGIITDIDYKTFHPVRKKYFGNSEVYAADKYRVFFKEEVVPGADPKTFKEIDYHTGQDKNRVYDGATPTQIRNYDRLRKIGNYMYSDGKYIYDSRFNVLPDADARTFKSISNCWYKDKNNVWWDTHLLPEANPRKFTPVTNYSFWSGKKERLGEDFNYGKDERNVFFQDSIISEVDVDSFEIINFPDGDSWTVFDRNRIYQGTDSPQLQKYLEEKYGDSEIKKGFKFLRKFPLRKPRPRVSL